MKDSMKLKHKELITYWQSKWERGDNIILAYHLKKTPATIVKYLKGDCDTKTALLITRFYNKRVKVLKTITDEVTN